MRPTVAAVLLMSFLAAADELPAGWKLATPVKKTGCDRKANDLLTARGDFDGDQKEDVARLLVKEKGRGLGVWVWRAAAKAPVLVVSFEQKEGEHDLGIARVNPGTYATACGKGYWPCAAHEPAKLTLENAGLDVFTCESSNQYVWWDSKSKAFKTIGITD